jgi:uncharacterized protein (UPF0264 family)
LLDHWPLEDLEQFVGLVRRSGLFSVLAGSLSFDSIPRALALRPDYIAVRGAACRGPRTQQLDASLLTRLVDLVQSSSKNQQPSVSGLH